MIRIILFLALIAALAAGAAWVADQPGDVVLSWGGWRAETTLPVFVLGIGIVVAVAPVRLRAAGAARYKLESVDHRERSRELARRRRSNRAPRPSRCSIQREPDRPGSASGRWEDVSTRRRREHRSPGSQRSTGASVVPGTPTYRRQAERSAR